MMDKLTTRITWAIETIKDDKDLDKGITDVDLAKNLGTDKNTLARYRQGKGLLKGEVINNLVARYNFNPMWLFRGHGEPFPGARAKYPDVCGPESSSFEAMPVQPDFPPDDYVFIGRVHGKISAGGGLTPDNDVDTAGFYESAFWGQKYPKVQLLTVAELLAGKKMEMPPIRQVGATFKKAPKVGKKIGMQDELEM